LDILKNDYPDYWREIVTSNNNYPPMSLRINPGKVTREVYLDMLKEAGIDAILAPDWTPYGIVLKVSVDVDKLPQFREGYVSVQDLAAQLTPQLLNIRPGQRVLDACAAPGGKLAHILEYEPKVIEATGVESERLRYEKLQQTLDRLQLRARLLHADAREP